MGCAIPPKSWLIISSAYDPSFDNELDVPAYRIQADMRSAAAPISQQRLTPHLEQKMGIRMAVGRNTHE
jgi:hypothetical protein